MAILVHFYVNWVENLNWENLKLAAWKLIILKVWLPVVRSQFPVLTQCLITRYICCDVFKPPRPGCLPREEGWQSCLYLWYLWRPSVVDLFIRASLLSSAPSPCPPPWLSGKCNPCNPRLPPPSPPLEHQLLIWKLKLNTNVRWYPCHSVTLPRLGASPPELFQDKNWTSR